VCRGEPQYRQYSLERRRRPNHHLSLIKAPAAILIILAVEGSFILFG
jgi:hypothetical protein